jgi:penicillin-binding protein 2
MVSSPKFNPNAYEFENANWSAWLEEMANDPAIPQFNRAAEGQYPLGSVFKVITMAAALESGLYTPETIYECGYVFDELPDFPRYDWTYEHFKEDGETQPSGTLTLEQGLIRSCNPYFWHIGLDLYNHGEPEAISDMAKGFGLGSKTGIQGIEEEPGYVPIPGSQVDAINLAIGQGELLVTPLQVANFMAAIGNGGTLYKPQIIDHFQSEVGNISNQFRPIEIGELPISIENLKVIQESMAGVVSSRKPMGTAYLQLNSLKIPVAGKTGTATSGSGKPHAWFAGYTFANKPNKPDIAIAVIAENQGEGSEWAAPIFRRVVEIYFYGKPQRLFKWETYINVTSTPTSLYTETPTPKP